MACRAVISDEFGYHNHIQRSIGKRPWDRFCCDPSGHSNQMSLGTTAACRVKRVHVTRITEVEDECCLQMRKPSRNFYPTVFLAIFFLLKKGFFNCTMYKTHPQFRDHFPRKNMRLIHCILRYIHYN